MARDNNITWNSRKWTLVWSDEFDGEAGSPVNSDVWKPDLGGHGWSHDELQYYTDRPENASLDGLGNLAIVARRENAGYDCHYGKCLYTSARLTTRGRVQFTHGRVAARIQIPRGQGLWPAFWMVGSQDDMGDWPVSGEIDIMENIGKEPRVVHANLHGPGYYGGGGKGRHFKQNTDFADAFHVYAIDWDADAIRWYVDGTLYHTVTPDDVTGNPWVFNHNFYLLLNVAVGGWWPGNPDDRTKFPQTMRVDYVRVYRLESRIEQEEIER